MKLHANAKMLVEWLRTHEPATVRQIASTGLMTSRAASDAVHYAVRHGVLEPLKSPESGMRGRRQYRLTGCALPDLKVTGAAPDFDGLLTAWGISLQPPSIPALTSRRVEFSD